MTGMLETDPPQGSRAAEKLEGIPGVATSKVVTRVFEELLAAIHEGTLRPGEHISDTALATRYGVSRTPVREALQRLREIGVVEASANRFTRVAVMSPQKTAEAVIVWSALFGALLEETIPLAGPDVFEAMTQDHLNFKLAAAALEMEVMATHNFSFYGRLSPLSKNELLKRAIVSVVHVVRLGSLYLPEYLDFAALQDAQALLLEAVRTQNVPLAHDAMTAIRNIRIPS